MRPRFAGSLNNYINGFNVTFSSTTEEADRGADNNDHCSLPRRILVVLVALGTFQHCGGSVFTTRSLVLLRHSHREPEMVLVVAASPTIRSHGLRSHQVLTTRLTH